MEKLNYRDVTNNWIECATPCSNNILHAKFFEDDNGIRYKVDSKERKVWFDYNSKDYRETIFVMHILRRIFGGKFEIQPKVDSPSGVSVCDFKWKRPGEVSLEKWDLKTVEGNSARTLDNMIKNRRRQSNNFIFDIRKSAIDEENAKNQISRIFNDPHRDWVEKIMLISGCKIIFIYQRKK